MCYPISDSSPVKSEDREGGLMAARVTFSHSYQSPTRKCQLVNIFETLFYAFFCEILPHQSNFYIPFKPKPGSVSQSTLSESKLEEIDRPMAGGCKFQELSVKSVGQGGLLNAALAMEGVELHLSSWSEHDLPHRTCQGQSFLISKNSKLFFFYICMITNANATDNKPRKQ